MPIEFKPGERVVVDNSQTGVAMIGRIVDFTDTTVTVKFEEDGGGKGTRTYLKGRVRRIEANECQ